MKKRKERNGLSIKIEFFGKLHITKKGKKKNNLQKRAKKRESFFFPPKKNSHFSNQPIRPEPPTNKQRACVMVLSILLLPIHNARCTCKTKSTTADSSSFFSFISLVLVVIFNTTSSSLSLLNKKGVYFKR